jgi:hypothetical protein
VVEARCQVVEGLRGITQFFVTEKFPVDECGHYPLDDQGYVLLEGLISLVEMLHISYFEKLLDAYLNLFINCLLLVDFYLRETTSLVHWILSAIMIF